MVTVLHVGRVRAGSAALAQDEGQGAGGQHEGEIRHQRVPETSAHRATHLVGTHTELGLLRQTRLQHAAGSAAAVHAEKRHQRDGPV